MGPPRRIWSIALLLVAFVIRNGYANQRSQLTPNVLAATLDLFPTLAQLIGAELPKDRIIDGKDIWSLMADEPNAASPHEVFYCYYNGELRAVRDRRWKLFFPHRSNTLGDRPGGRDGTPARYDQLEVGRWLFDLRKEIGETMDVAAKHPEIVARLEQYAETARRALGDTLTDRKVAKYVPLES